MIEIGEMVDYERELQDDSIEQKSSNLTLISRRNCRSKSGVISETLTRKLTENLK